MRDQFMRACGRVWYFPDYVEEHWHILYTLICDCARVYTVRGERVELRTRPVWPWKRPQR